MNKTELVVKRLGGVNAVAELLNISKPAIYKWMKDDRIPEQRGIALYFECQCRPDTNVAIEEIFHHIPHRYVRNYFNNRIFASRG